MALRIIVIVAALAFLAWNWRTLLEWATELGSWTWEALQSFPRWMYIVWAVLILGAALFAP